MMALSYHLSPAPSVTQVTVREKIKKIHPAPEEVTQGESRNSYGLCFQDFSRRWSWSRSAIMAMNSELVGFPLALDTVNGLKKPVLGQFS